MSDLALFLRLALAAVFGLAAVGKLLDMRGSHEAVKGFGVPATITPIVTVLLPLVEAVIAIALVPASSAVAGAAAALALLAVFIILISIQLARGRRPDCHCFGQLHSSPVGLGTLVRNLVLAGGAVIVITADGGKTMTVWWDGLTATGRMGFVIAGSLGVLVVAEAAILWKLFVRYGKLLMRVEDLEAVGPMVAPSSLAVRRSRPRHWHHGPPICASRTSRRDDHAGIAAGPGPPGVAPLHGSAMRSVRCTRPGDRRLATGAREPNDADDHQPWLRTRQRRQILDSGCHRRALATRS